ncbi:Immunoglobulin lambda-1 light chain [Merluccius polli]|nr:Immunoglobulin lambda-1 light chain [Merluccius polli]
MSAVRRPPPPSVQMTSRCFLSRMSARRDELTSCNAGQPETFPLHTDNMLGTLGSLLAALTCVSAAIVVTQQPSVVTLRTGETATVDCNVGSITGYVVGWLKQIPGGVPQFVLYFHQSLSSVTYGSGFSSPHFKSTCQSNSDCRLIINNVVEGDSAVYYCYSWDDSAKEQSSQRVWLHCPHQVRRFLYGHVYKLNHCGIGRRHQGSSLPPPSLTVYRPSTNPLSSSQAALVCLARQMSIGFAEVSWLVNGSPVTDGTTTSTAVQQLDKTFQISSYLSLQARDFSEDRTYTCKVAVGSGTFEKTIRMSECVSAVTVVTQQPSVVTLRTGETATVDCNLGSITVSAARWFKQIPGGVTQHVLQFHKSWGSVTYGSGFSSPYFKSTCQSNSDCRLIITNMVEGDSAVYYCYTWDGSANEYSSQRVWLHCPHQVRRFLYGHVYKLNHCGIGRRHQGSSLPPPSLTVYRPSTNPLSSSQAALVCLARQMSIGFAEVSWLVNGSPVTDGTTTSTAVQQLDETFQISSYLSLQACDFSEDRTYTCKVAVGSGTFEKTIRMSECNAEEAASPRLWPHVPFVVSVRVSAAAVVTQQPSVVTLRTGETATVNCNVGSITGSLVGWLKQIPGGVPQFVLYFHQSLSSVGYGSGFSSPHFTSTCQSLSDCRLIINNVVEGDSAVYYCNTYSAKEQVSQRFLYGHVYKLNHCGIGRRHQGSSLPPPSLTVYRPSTNPLLSSQAALVCLARQMSIGFAEVSWLVNGSPVTDGTTTSTAVQQLDETFQISSYLSLQARVSAVTVVTQQPSVVTLRTGETANVDCNLGSITGYTARWLKQIPGGVPQFVLRFHQSWSSVKYGSGFSSPHFTSTCQSLSDCRLIINNVVEGDSAVYYCYSWDDSAKEVVSQRFLYGHVYKLNHCGIGRRHQGSSLPPPSLTVYRPSTNPLSSSQAALVCLARQMSIGFAEVSWLVNGSPVTDGTPTSTAVQQLDQTFQISSYLSLQARDFSEDRTYTCKVAVGSGTFEKTIRMSESGQPETFPLHTDNMLGTLGSLLAALTCVSAATVVTQQPSVVTLRTGETATVDCNLGSVTDSARWLKQIPGGVPQYVLRFYHGWSSVKYASGFSSPHFTSTSQSKSDYRLIINNVVEGDSAVYHCFTWDKSANETVSQVWLHCPHQVRRFLYGHVYKLNHCGIGRRHQGIFLHQNVNVCIVEYELHVGVIMFHVVGSSLPPPSLTVYRPSTNPLSSSQAALVCLARQMSIGFAEVSWLVNGSPVTDGTTTSTAVQQLDETFQISSYLSLQACDFSEDRTYTCKVAVGSGTFEKTIRMSESGQPETFPLHTDNMLGTLGSLLAALTCKEEAASPRLWPHVPFVVSVRVSAATVVTQQPSVVTLRTGETATVDCNVGSITGYAVGWFKQIPGGVPQFVLYFHQTWSSVKYGSGFSSPHFTSTCQSKSDCQLIINNVVEGDSAVYHCFTWDNSANETSSQRVWLHCPHQVRRFLYGHVYKLNHCGIRRRHQAIFLRQNVNVCIVEYELHVGVIMFHVVGSSLPPPSLTVYRPSTNPLSSSQAALVCLARQMSIGFAEVSWLVNGSPVTDGTTTSTAVQQLDETFQISSYLSLKACDFSEDRTYTCKVAVGSGTFEKTIRMSECNAVE